MALIGASQNPTLFDIIQRTDPMGEIATIIEILNLQNPILEEMTFMEGNLDVGMETTIRTGLPGVNWNKYYKRFKPDKSRTAQIIDQCASMIAYMEVDRRLADLNGRASQYRATESMAQMESFKQEHAKALFHASGQLSPEKFNGFGPRYNDLGAENADNIIDAGGTGSDNTSIWLVCWGPATVFGITPKGMPTGLQHEDLGIQMSETNEGLLQVYRDMFTWNTGLCVKDWRYVVRICNIDKSNLKGQTLSNTPNPDLMNFMIDAAERLPTSSMGRCVWYAPMVVKTALRKQMLRHTTNSTLTIEQIKGKPELTFNGWPIRQCDALAANETRVTDIS